MDSSIKVYRKRIEALVRVWSELLLEKPNNLSRDKLVEVLKNIYEEERVEPIRGTSIPQDIYYKELAALYYVGLHGLGIKDEIPQAFDDALKWEAKVEEAFKEAVSREDPTVLKKSFGEDVDEELIVKILRIPLTGALLGFEREENFKRFLHILRQTYPKLEDVIKNYARFYIALKIAEGIASGRIKDRKSKEAYKRAMAVSLGFERNIPSDNYIYFIARNVFRLRKKKLQKILSTQNASNANF